MQHLATHLQRLLAYHGWAYARLLGELASLDEEQYRAPCGLFFGSIHATLNHLAVADRIWLARVRDEAQPFARLDAEETLVRHQCGNVGLAVAVVAPAQAGAVGGNAAAVHQPRPEAAEQARGRQRLAIGLAAPALGAAVQGEHAAAVLRNANG